jgi:predicted hydrocarbon binding protein
MSTEWIQVLFNIAFTSAMVFISAFVFYRGGFRHGRELGRMEGRRDELEDMQEFMNRVKVNPDAWVATMEEINGRLN